MTGTVKWFSNEKGYGFITDEDGSDIFFHFSEIKKDGYKTIDAGKAVEFETVKDDKGIHAANIKEI